MKPLSRLPLNIGALNAGKGMSVDGAILRYSNGNNIMIIGAPIAVVSVCPSSPSLCFLYTSNAASAKQISYQRKQEPGDLGTARYEIPHPLLQAT